MDKGNQVIRKILYYTIIVIVSISCNKIKNKVKEKIPTPDYSYKGAKIDEFYYIRETVGNSKIIPLIKPYDMMKSGSPQEWSLATYELQNELGNVISPVHLFNVQDVYIYGKKTFEKDDIDSKFDSPEKWFIINTQEKKLIFFNKESDFKTELKKIGLPEKFLDPDEVYEQYKYDPVLPWFPEDIKKQLEGVKAKKE
ncbi:hypothetical protein [Chryseobacterium gossypii]|uniref:hypothetical protein n=1 Tax=Chryseobacterium gossypii TaxID=3231602 RepID=UPI003525F802